jgi:hypothetical protein
MRQIRYLIESTPCLAYANDKTVPTTGKQETQANIMEHHYKPIWSKYRQLI